MLTEIKDGLKKITEVERHIVKARLIGRSFCELSEDALSYAIDEIMIAGAAISGCALPQTEFFAKKIGEHLTVFINEYGYGELTVAEILTAMRLNSRGGLKFPTGLEAEQINFSGNCFNVDYLSKILHNYFSLRNILDGRFKNMIEGYE